MSSEENVQTVRELFNAFYSADDEAMGELIGDGDTVAVRYTCRGTHNGELFGVAPTNRTLTTSGIEMYRLSDGRIVECWGQYDMSQLFTPAS